MPLYIYHGRKEKNGICSKTQHSRRQSNHNRSKATHGFSKQTTESNARNSRGDNLIVYRNRYQNKDTRKAALREIAGFNS
jgi:hypothetical protein